MKTTFLFQLAIFCSCLFGLPSYGQLTVDLDVGESTEDFYGPVALSQRVRASHTGSFAYLAPHVGVQVLVANSVPSTTDPEVSVEFFSWEVVEGSFLPLSGFGNPKTRSDKETSSIVLGGLQFVDAAIGQPRLKSSALTIFGVETTLEARLTSRNIPIPTPFANSASANSTEYGDLKARASTTVTPDLFFLTDDFQPRGEARARVERRVTGFFDHPENFTFDKINLDFTLSGKVSRSYPGGEGLNKFSPADRNGMHGQATVKSQNIASAFLVYEGLEEDYTAAPVQSNSVVSDLTRISSTRSAFNFHFILQVSARSRFGTADTDASNTLSLDRIYFDNGQTPEEMGFELEFSDGAKSANLRPEVLRGDVDLNGVVDFSDIRPFIDVLTTGGFQDEADLDSNGTVDFQDIAPFILILSGQ